MAWHRERAREKARERHEESAGIGERRKKAKKPGPGSRQAKAGEKRKIGAERREVEEGGASRGFKRFP
jgi:hypothetical protein